MTTSTRSKAALLLSALLGTSWLVPLASGAASIEHPCSSAAEPSAPGHQGHEHGYGLPVPSNGPAVESHECLDCSAEPCSRSDHCALTAPVALPSAPSAIEVVTSASLPLLWMRDRPLSANPTPPIPPPQPVL